MGGSARSSSDEELGCAVLLGIAVLALVVWLAWLAVLWFVADWRWAWITGTGVIVPLVAYGVIVAWREPQPFAPSFRHEAWFSAVGVAVALAAPVLVLVKGWGTACVALVVGALAGSLLGLVPRKSFEFPQLLPPAWKAGGSEEAP